MKGAVHKIKYRYTCEGCGKQTDWFTSEIEEVTETTGAGELLSSVVNKDRFKKQLEKFKEKTEGGVYDYHFQGGASCPFCGKRQSWMPAVVTLMSPAIRIVAYMGGWLFIGVVLLIIAIVLQDAAEIFEWIAYDGWALLILIPVLIGMLFALRRNKIIAGKNQAHQDAVTVRNKPEIEWNGI